MAHNGSLVPVPGRDIVVQAWYQGGISIVDFTDIAHPFRNCLLRPRPRLIRTCWCWAAIGHSLLVQRLHLRFGDCPRTGRLLNLTASKFLTTEQKSTPAKTVHVAELNVQNQQKIEWPAKLVVAKAYVDQLERSQALPADQIAALRAAMDKNKLGKLKSMAPSLEKSASAAKTPADSKRLHALAEILKHPSA